MDHSENYTNSTRRLILDTNLIPFQEMPLDKFDVEKYVEAYASANVNCIFQITKDHRGQATYHTKIGTRNKHLKIDLLAEVIKHAHARGIKVNAYYSLAYDDAILEKHPDWACKDKSGNDMCHWKFWQDLHYGCPCFNSPYRQFVLDQITELSKGYDADLYWVDCLQQGEVGLFDCYCEHCKTAYREKFGKEIPVEAAWDKEWKQQMKWRLNSIESFWQEIIDTVHKYKPGFPVCRNYGQSWLNKRQWLHLVKGEEFLDSDVGVDCSAGSILRGLCKNKAFHFGINTCLGGVQDRGPSPYRYKLRTMNQLLHGGNSVMGAAETPYYPDGTLEKEDFKMWRACFDEVAQKEPYIQGAVSLPYAGILLSDATRVFYAGSKAKHEKARRSTFYTEGASVREEFTLPLFGAIGVLSDPAIPFGVIPDWEIGSEVLKKYPILVLPNVAAMSAEHAEALKSYVAEGGRILASFESSLYDAEGNQLEDFQLADVFGLKYLGESGQDPNLLFMGSVWGGTAPVYSYLTPTRHEIFKGLPEGNLRLKSQYVKTKVVSGETIAYHRDPAELVFKGKKVSWGALPGELTDFPAIHINCHGKGKAVFVTSRIFRLCGWEEGETPKPGNFWWLRTLIRNLLGLLDANPPLRVEAPPETVEATFWENPEKKQIIVQLLNKAGREAIIPIENVKLHIRKDIQKPKEAYLAWPEKKNLEIKEGEGGREILLPKIGMHEIIILQS